MQKKSFYRRHPILVWVGVIIVAIFALSFALSSGEEPSAPSTGPSEALLNIKCDRAIAPDRAANYQVINTGDNIFVVSGQTLAGARYYCAYKWSGGDNLALMESGVDGR